MRPGFEFFKKIWKKSWLWRKKIYFKNRPSISYSNLVLNYGSETKVSEEYEDLVSSNIAFPIKPFFQAYELIKNEDKYDSEKEQSFVIVGSGLAAIEVAFALRKRWQKRSLKILCKSNKVNNKILKTFYRSKSIINNFNSNFNNFGIRN